MFSLLPSEVALPRAVAEIPPKLKEKWQWKLFERVSNSICMDRNLKSNTFLDNFEEQYNKTQQGRFNAMTATNYSFVYSIWEEEKYIQTASTKRRREEEMSKDRSDQSHGTWEEVYQNAKRIDRSKNNLHERDDEELERTGQPLCIYERYFGGGTWSFLHQKALYRGIGLSTKGRRPKAEDVDPPYRLPVLSSPYYRDLLGEYGAFFAIANQIDRIHKNAWIGFQSWRITARKDKHCYSRLLELLINVWAYHSARRMVYVHPESGVMQEQHGLKSRRSHIWIKWFHYSTLKNMDEDLAEETDLEQPTRRWLWPSTGEVFWKNKTEYPVRLTREQLESM